MKGAEIIAAALRWHAANIKRLEASSESNRYKRDQKAATGFGGADFRLSRKVTEGKRIELAALRALANACVESQEIFTIDVDATEPSPAPLCATESKVPL